MNGRQRGAAKKVMLLLALSLLLCVTFFAFVAYERSQRVGTTPNPGSPLVGTWKGEDENMVVQYRPDGTGRYRGAQNRIHYFEWMMSGGEELVFVHECSSHATAWKSHLHGWLLGTDDLQRRISIKSISSDQFTLQSAEGEESTFVPTSDPVMEASP